MFGRITMERPGFPYTFPIDFTLQEVSQVFDDAETNYNTEIRRRRETNQHVDLTWFISTPIFPVDGSAPTTPTTQTVLQINDSNKLDLATRKSNQAAVIEPEGAIVEII